MERPRRTAIFHNEPVPRRSSAVGLAPVDALHLLSGAALDQADVDSAAEENAGYFGKLVCSARGLKKLLAQLVEVQTLDFPDLEIAERRKQVEYFS